jgi:predicted DNA-binding WGR domain protein
MRWTAGRFAATFKPMNNRADLPLRLERIDATRNMWRYYDLMLQPTLFGEISVVRSWGRIGAPGRYKTMTFSNLGEATRALKRLEAVKRRRGYSDDPGHDPGGVAQDRARSSGTPVRASMKMQDARIPHEGQRFA